MNPAQGQYFVDYTHTLSYNVVPSAYLHPLRHRKRTIARPGCIGRPQAPPSVLRGIGGIHVVSVAVAVPVCSFIHFCCIAL